MRPLLLLSVFATAGFTQEGWWMREPVRWVQTNLREVDAGLDAKRLVNQLADLRANVLLFGMGGIAAYYPTKVEFHYASPFLPPGRDLFGEVLRESHARRIRVVGRFDFSKTQKSVYDAHPDWFFQKADGTPVIFNGLYSTCINGPYYRVQALKILTEALERYDVDGLFFNMFGNQSNDYAGSYVGLCHCANCRAKYRSKTGREIPEKADDDYREFLRASAYEVSAVIGKLIHSKRPRAGYFNYMQDLTDGIMSESNTALGRALPLWPYSASDNVNRARNSQPGKMAVNLNMQFVDFPWRFATVPRGEIAMRMWQNLAHGGALTLAVNGTLDQQDRQALETAKPIFRWAAEKERYYAGQRNAARVLLLAGGDDSGYRGLFRLLTEEHIPFAVSDNLDWMGRGQYDLVVTAGAAPAKLARYVEDGGHLLIATAKPPAFPIAQVEGTADQKGYIRVRDHRAFPSLVETDLLLLNGPFTEVTAEGPAPLTFVPPSMIGPPEKIHIDMKDTTIPGIVARRIGKGSVTWLPWELGALYYRLSLPAHAGLFRDVADRLNSARQLKTDAHPLVEMVLMEQQNRKLLHLINVSGHSQTAYFPPVPMKGIRVELAGKYEHARTIRGGATLAVRQRGAYSELTIPELIDYELVVIE